LGLDAPQKLDVSGIYQRGGDDLSAEQRAQEAVIEALPIKEQRRIYELFYQAGVRAKAGDLSQPMIESTVSNGSDIRTDPDAGTERDPVLEVDGRRLDHVPRLADIETEIVAQPFPDKPHNPALCSPDSGQTVRS
jgi:hypothetical protein